VETAARRRAWTRASAKPCATSPSCAATVQLVAPGSLPNDGKVIEDARSYK
jgi:hypothetical protein